MAKQSDVVFCKVCQRPIALRDAVFQSRMLKSGPMTDILCPDCSSPIFTSAHDPGDMLEPEEVEG